MLAIAGRVGSTFRRVGSKKRLPHQFNWNTVPNVMQYWFHLPNVLFCVHGTELSTGRMDLRVGPRVGSDFLSAIAGRVGSTFRRVGSVPRKMTRGQLWHGIIIIVIYCTSTLFQTVAGTSMVSPLFTPPRHQPSLLHSSSSYLTCIDLQSHS